MPKIEGLDRLQNALRARAAATMKDASVSVVVGYTAAYALYVHENMEINPPGMILAGVPRPTTARGTSQGSYWDPQGRAQPKFLEQPFRQNRDDYFRIVVNAFKRGNTMAQALLLAGLKLQRDSQLLVPVNTGNLKASAFTRLEGAYGGGRAL